MWHLYPLILWWHYSILTHCDLVMPYGNIDLGQHCLGNALVPDSAKPLPESMMTYDQWGFVALRLDQCHSKCSQYQFIK